MTANERNCGVFIYKVDAKYRKPNGVHSFSEKRLDNDNDDGFFFSLFIFVHLLNN